MSNIKKIAVMTSGGDSPGMNAALRAVVRSCVYYDIKCYGIKLGYQGLIEGKIKQIGARGVKNILHRGGTILKTARSTEFRTKEGREKAYQNLKKNNIDGLVVIGGDGTFTGGCIFEKEYGIPVVGIPGTIDNDIYGTDYTLGYDTALNTVVEAVDKIRDTASSHNRLFFVEVMGRNAGFIALNSGIASGAQEVFIPEKDQSPEDLFKSLESSQKAGKSSNIVIVAEGDRIGGGVYSLAKMVKQKYDHYDIRVTVLGHIQRGGTPTCKDRVLASRFGLAAVKCLISGESSVMVGVKNDKIITQSLKASIKSQNPIEDELWELVEVMRV